MGLGHGAGHPEASLCASPLAACSSCGISSSSLWTLSHPPFSVLMPNIWKKVKHLLPQHRMSSGFQMEDAFPPDAGGMSHVPAQRATLPPNCCPLRRLVTGRETGPSRWGGALADPPFGLQPLHHTQDSPRGLG